MENWRVKESASPPTARCTLARMHAGLIPQACTGMWPLQRLPVLHLPANDTFSAQNTLQYGYGYVVCCLSPSLRISFAPLSPTAEDAIPLQPCHAPAPVKSLDTMRLLLHAREAAALRMQATAPTANDAEALDRQHTYLSCQQPKSLRGRRAEVTRRGCITQNPRGNSRCSSAISMVLKSAISKFWTPTAEVCPVFTFFEEGRGVSECRNDVGLARGSGTAPKPAPTCVQVALYYGFQMLHRSCK